MAAIPVSFSVDGRPVRTAPQRLLIHVLRELGIEVPTLCHDDRLTPYGGCRLCVVERIDGPGGLVPACSTRVQDGMVIRTAGRAVLESRQQQLQLIALNHHMECPVCERNSDCRLQDLIHQIGVPAEMLPFELAPAARDDASPVIIRDPGKCVVCGRCVRLCEEVQGVAALALLGRGISTRVGTFRDRPLDCEFCGQCVNACPVGALVARPYVSQVPAWQRSRVDTTCSFCACGCEVSVENHHGRLQKVGSRIDGSHNRGKLCVKGWLGLDVVADAERLTEPLLRRDGELVPASWNEALATAADGLRRAAGRGPVMTVGGGRLSCEDGYLLQALAREVLRTPHVDMAPVGGARALVDGVREVFERPRSTIGFDGVREADLVVVIGSDPSRGHPLVKTELVQAAVQRGVAVVVVSPVAGGLDRHAADVLRVAPGSTHDLLCLVASQLLRIDRAAAHRVEHLPGVDDWRRSLDPYTLDVAEASTGLAAGRVESLAARLAAARRPALVMGTGTGVAGDEAAVARAAASLTAALGGGAGLLVLGGRSNVQGLVDVGLHPRLLAGHRGVGRSVELEDLTGRATLHDEGWTVADWLAADGTSLAGLLLVGVDLVELLPGGQDPRRWIEAAGYTVVVDAFLTATATRADVVLPAAILSEREGTTVAADGVRRPLRRALDPPPGVRPDGEILAELARRMGGRLPVGDELRAELDRVVGWGRSSSQPSRLPPEPPPSTAPVVPGFLLDAGPQLFHSGSVTSRSRQLQELSPTVAARLNPADARALGVSRGEVVAVASERGEVLLRARLDRAVQRGTVAVPWGGSHDGASALFELPDEVVSVRVRRAGA